VLRPYSALKTVMFPVLPTKRAAAALAVQYQLDHSQWLPPDELWQIQRAQLDVLVRHAWTHAPQWRARLDAAGYHHDRPIDRATFERIPLLGRADVQDTGQALRCAVVPADHGQVFEAATSGSTGVPVRVNKTTLCNFIWQALFLREHRWHGRDLSGKLAVIRHQKDLEAELPDGLRQEQWGAATNLVCPTGPSVHLSIWIDPKDQARWLQREDPDYLVTYPSNLRALADRFERRTRRLRSLREIRTVSEMLDPATRAHAEAVFGVPVTDLYATQEVGCIGMECPERRGFHVQAEACVVEVLDDDGRPCEPGCVGRVVVTPLHNFAQPLLRYDVGDLAEVGRPCSCGRGLPVLARVLGRVRNMIAYPDGRRAWPLFRDHRFADVAPVRQYQIVQPTVERLDVRLVVDRPLRPDEEAALRRLLVERLEFPFEIAFAYPDVIERSPGGKYEDFRSEV